MSIRRCHHIKTNGLVCGSPALRGRAYCYFHHQAGVRERRRSINNGQNISCIEFGNLETHEEVQASIVDVLTALVHRRVEQHVAGKLLYGLQLAMRNIDAINPADPRMTEAVDDLGPEPGIGPHDFDLLQDRLAHADRQLTNAMLHPTETLTAQVIAEYPDYKRTPAPATNLAPAPSSETALASPPTPNLIQQRNARFLARMRA